MTNASPGLSPVMQKILMSHLPLPNKYTLHTQSVILVFFSQSHLIKEECLIQYLAHHQKQVFK